MEMAEEGQNQATLVPNRILETIQFIEEEDRISALPDSLLVEILSRLHLKGSIRAGTLSKRWKHLWTLIPTLIFSHNDVIRDFVLFVDKTLTQRPQFKLKKFVVDIMYDVQYESQVKSWIRYAISCNVEELDLTLWDMKLAEFPLDQSFFICSSFTDLTLEGCMFHPDEAISWKNLRRLCISYGNLDEVLIENILSGSPQLETLVLNDCYGYRRLNITAKSVKNLVLSGYFDPTGDYDSSFIEINAPDILSLAIRDYLLLEKLLLVDVSSLVEANLDYTKDEITPEEAEAEEEMLKGLILNLSHVKDLKIGASLFSGSVSFGS